MAEGKDLFAVLEERFNLAEELLNKCKKLEAHVEGSHKLQRKNQSRNKFSVVCQGEYGERDLIDQAKDFIDCSENHVVHFQNPLVSFVFCNGVTKSLATSLTDLGISVQGDVLLDPCDSDSSLANASSIPLPVISQESLAM
ncbi:hypothetical protein QZH41_017532 [Actinostola sp. cb2023]|nr:hypothetical protein QZH41_017532 [Actinostola sp. cb2023]